MKVLVGYSIAGVGIFAGVMGIEKTVSRHPFIQRRLDKEYKKYKKIDLEGYIVGPSLLISFFPLGYIGYKITKNGIDDLHEIAQY